VIKAVRGTNDILPDQISAWHKIEAVAREIFGRYGYREIRTPVFEQTELFARGIGGETDIVSKEMYTFTDRDEAESSLTLRPEATAGIVRAVIEHNLLNMDPLAKVYAFGPMFRRERPQKGRFRQFNQVDVEAFGLKAPGIDIEIIELALAYLDACGLTNYDLALNSVGDANCRPAYVETLRQALADKASQLCGDCQRRATTNPLRVLDCKVPQDQPIINALPRIADHLCDPCREHFAAVRAGLDAAGIAYQVSHRLVRGLDYYVRTTFEVTTNALGAQNSVLGGGRYDGLVKELGGPDAPGIGFALGMERLVMLLEAPPDAARCDVFLLPLVDSAVDEAMAAQRALRRAGVRVAMDYEGRSFKSRMKLADKLGARIVAIRGDDERAKGVWALRDMGSSDQKDVAESGLIAEIERKLNG
jgi:histidyl-tRNA synthetase